MKILSVNGHSYQASEKIVENTLSIVVGACKQRKSNMIYAIQKKNHVDMVQLKYDTKESMEIEVQKYRKDGFKVFRCSFGV